jgi:hypothetical protein
MSLGANEIVKIVSTINYLGTTLQNVFFYEQSQGAAGTISLSDIVEAFDSKVTVAWQGILPTNAQIVSYYGQTISANASNPPTYISPVEEYLDLSGVFGTAASEGLPPFVAFVVSKRSGSADRRKRGRWYFGPVPEEFQAAGRLVPGSIGPIEDFRDLLDDGLEFGGPPPTASLTPVILSKSAVEEGLGLVSLPAASTPITLLLIDLVLRRQVRRQYGVGI